LEAKSADCLIDLCPASCELIRAVYAEVDSCCRECPLSGTGEGCPEQCVAYRILRLVPANFDFGRVRDSEA